MKKIAVIDCAKDSDLYVTILSTLQNKLAGKPIYYSDHLGDLVNRHCPELYTIADDAGFRFVPSDDKGELTQNPPQFWFDVIRKDERPN